MLKTTHIIILHLRRLGGHRGLPGPWSGASRAADGDGGWGRFPRSFGCRQNSAPGALPAIRGRWGGGLSPQALHTVSCSSDPVSSSVPTSLPATRKGSWHLRTQSLMGLGWGPTIIFPSKVHNLSAICKISLAT